MQNNTVVGLPVEIHNMIQNPFVFVSYCQKNQSVVNKVKEMVSYLRNSGVTVVYDEGGLTYGADLQKFEELILHDNCYKVLVVSDQSYCERIQNDDERGGAWREYSLIRGEYTKNPDKYIVIKADKYEVIPAFRRQIYFNLFTDDFEELVNILRISNDGQPHTKKSVDSDTSDNHFIWLSLEMMAQEASQLYDECAYKAADKKIDEAINLYNNIQKSNHEIYAKLCSIKIRTSIKLNDSEIAVRYADRLYSILNTLKSVSEDMAIYYSNCALAYRMQDKSSPVYEKCAKNACNLAKESNVDDKEYYMCLYAVALYDMEKYTRAYQVIQQASKSIQYKIRKGNEVNGETRKQYLQIIGNEAEIAVKCSEVVVNRHDKYNYLADARKNVDHLLETIKENDGDGMNAEAFHIAQLVYKAISEYYGYKN